MVDYSMELLMEFLILFKINSLGIEFTTGLYILNQTNEFFSKPKTLFKPLKKGFLV